MDKLCKKAFLMTEDELIERIVTLDKAIGEIKEEWDRIEGLEIPEGLTDLYLKVESQLQGAMIERMVLQKVLTVKFGTFIMNGWEPINQEEVA